MIYYFDGTIVPTNLSTAKRRYRHTDAGLRDAFVVEACDATTVLEGAQRWLRVRADDDEPLMPDDLALVEVEYAEWKTFMILVVT